MEPEVLASLITAGAALLVSVITALTVVAQSRATNRLAVQAAQAQDERSALRAEENAYRTAIQDCCAAAQGFQDEIQLLARGARGTLLSTSAHDRVYFALDTVLQAYQRHHAVLAVADRSSFFAIREKTIEVVIALEFAGAWSERLLRITEEQTVDLERTTHFMNQHQQSLWLGAARSLTSVRGLSDE